MEQKIENELTYKIIDAEMEVHNTPGYSFPNHLAMILPYSSNIDSQNKIPKAKSSSSYSSRKS